MISERDIAWLAGVFDGEGCVFVQRSKRKGGRTVLSLQLTMGNTSAELVERYVRILRELGVTPQVVFDDKYSNAKLPVTYVKVARKRDALVFAKAIIADATAKRAELQMAIWYLERSCKVRQHVATPQDIEVLDAISGVKHGTSLPAHIRLLTALN